MRTSEASHSNGRLGRWGTFDLPVTQAELADTTGLSAVHVNRVLQQLREERLIELEGRRLIVRDPERLKRFAGFDPAYLHRNGVVGGQIS